MTFGGHDVSLSRGGDVMVMMSQRLELITPNGDIIMSRVYDVMAAGARTRRSSVRVR